MKFTVHKTVIRSLLGALIVSACPLSTLAAGRCESVFGNSSYLKESLTSARATNNAVVDLFRKYKNSPHELTIEEVRTQVNSFGKKAVAYFSDAGIESQSHMEIFKFKNLKDAKEFVISYPVFTIKGSRSGDEVARLLNGIHSNPKFNKHPVRVEFDSLYLFKNQSMGHYESEGNKISVGPHVIAEEIRGVSNTLRHEAQHYFEQMKIYENQMTMARISFSESSNKSGDPYGTYFRMDELETHLRDIRTLLNFKARAEKDKVLFQNLEPDIIAKVKGDRPRYIEDKMHIMNTLMKSSETMMSHLKSQLANRSPDQIMNTKIPGENIAVYVVDDVPYSIVRVNLYGVFNKPQYELSRGEIQQGIEKVFIWHSNRLQAIKKEFESLQRSYRNP
ncbi:MAG: hypothetical protein ACKOX6_05020 [Bdellovibrio sp.]